LKKKEKEKGITVKTIEEWFRFWKKKKKN